MSPVHPHPSIIRLHTPDQRSKAHETIARQQQQQRNQEESKPRRPHPSISDRPPILIHSFPSRRVIRLDSVPPPRSVPSAPLPLPLRLRRGPSESPRPDPKGCGLRPSQSHRFLPLGFPTPRSRIRWFHPLTASAIGGRAASSPPSSSVPAPASSYRYTARASLHGGRRRRRQHGAGLRRQAAPRAFALPGHACRRRLILPHRRWGDRLPRAAGAVHRRRLRTRQDLRRRLVLQGSLTATHCMGVPWPARPPGSWDDLFTEAGR